MYFFSSYCPLQIWALKTCHQNISKIIIAIVLLRSNDHVIRLLVCKHWNQWIRLAYSAARFSFENYLILACIAQLVESLAAENPFIFQYTQVRMPSTLSFHFINFYCVICSHVSFMQYWKTVLTFLQSVHQMGHYQTPKHICEMPLNASTQ